MHLILDMCICQHRKHVLNLMMVAVVPYKVHSIMLLQVGLALLLVLQVQLLHLAAREAGAVELYPRLRQQQLLPSFSEAST